MWDSGEIWFDLTRPRFKEEVTFEEVDISDLPLYISIKYKTKFFEMYLKGEKPEKVFSVYLNNLEDFE